MVILNSKIKFYADSIKVVFWIMDTQYSWKSCHSIVMKQYSCSKSLLFVVLYVLNFFVSYTHRSDIIRVGDSCMTEVVWVFSLASTFLVGYNVKIYNYWLELVFRKQKVNFFHTSSELMWSQIPTTRQLLVQSMTQISIPPVCFQQSKWSSELKIVIWLTFVLVFQIALAVREGYSWARNNLHLATLVNTVHCGVVLRVYLLGQAQLHFQFARALHSSQCFPHPQAPVNNP